MEKKLVVNADGWFAEVLNEETGKESRLCPGRKMIKVKVLGYTDWFESKIQIYKDDIRKHYPVGRILLVNEANFKPYPEYVGFKCGEWIKK